MFTRILVPLDGSDRAEQALLVAARLARASKGSVILAQATPTSSPFWPERKKSPESLDTVAEEIKALAASYLDQASRRAELVGVKTETRVEYGDIAPSLLVMLEPLGIDLIVMCSHGYGGFKRWALGSTAHKIISQSQVPVLVLRDGASTFSAKSINALVALDGSPLAERVLGPVVALLTALAPSMPKTLHLVRVVDQPVMYGRFAVAGVFDMLREEVHEAQAYLTAMAQRLTERKSAIPDFSVTTSFVVKPDVAEALVQREEQERQSGGGFDLIAMATHGRGGLQRWMMGSVTERVLYATKLPLLIVRPGKQEHGRLE